MTTTGWREATRQDPCPVCGKPDWCSVSADGQAVACRRVDTGAGEEREDRSGGLFWLYQLGDGHRPAAPPPPPAKAMPPRADPETLNRVYRSLLRELRLSDRHRADLRARGLTDQAIRRGGYRSLPLRGRAALAGRLVEAHGADTCATVPGFYIREEGDRRYWTLAGSVGLVIPVRDAEGRIVALKVRADDPGDGSRYTTVSSSKRGGPGPGAPIHVPAGFNGDRETVRLTEGELKADVATALSGILTVSVPGVSTWRPALAVLHQLGAVTVAVAFDADAETNQHVGRAAERTEQALLGEGFRVVRETWPATAGKGIDDLLAGNGVPETTEVAMADNEADKLEAEAGALVAALVDTVTAAEPGDRPQLVTAALDGGIADALAELLETDPAAAEAARGRLRDAMPRGEVGRATGLFDAATKQLQARRQAERNARRQAAAVAADDRRHQDLALAEAFAEAHRSALLPAAGRQWYRYADGVWAKRDEDEVRGILWRFVDAESLDGANLRTVNSVYDAVATLTGWRADDRALNANPMLVNVQNGVYDLETGKLLPHDPDLLQTVQRPFEYDPEATCPRWNQFLAEALVTTDGAPDTALASLLQEWFGYCLVPTTRAHKACIWTGEGSNGKGVATGILTALVGEENSVGTDIAKLDDDYKRADLRDKLLAVSSEVPSRALVADATFKAVVSGDLLAARLPYAPPFSFRPYARILITCNDLPATSDRTWGFYRRLILMPWNARFDGDAVNPDLEAELREAELPGIFRWAVNGLARLIQQGWRFTPADAAARTLEEYRLEGNNVALWAADRVELVEGGGRVASSELYADYSDYCKAGNLHAFGISQFPRKLKDVLPDIQKNDNRNGKGWSGLALLPHDPYLAPRRPPDPNRDPR